MCLTRLQQHSNTMSEQHLSRDDYRELERSAISWARRRRAQANAAAADRRADESRLRRRGGVISAAETAQIGKTGTGSSNASYDEGQCLNSSFGDTDDDDDNDDDDDDGDDVTERMSNTASSSSRTMTKTQISAAVIGSLCKSFQSITSTCSNEYQIDDDMMSNQEDRMESSSLLRLFEDTTPPPDNMTSNASSAKSSSSSSSHSKTRLQSSAAIATSLSESFAGSSNTKEYLVEDEIHKTQEHSKKNSVHEFEDVMTASSSDDDDSVWRMRALTWPLTKSQSSAIANTLLSENVARIIDEMKNEGRHLDHHHDMWNTQEKPRIPSSLLDDGAASSNKHYENQCQRPSEWRSSSQEHSSIFNTSSVVLPPSERLMRIREELQKKAQQMKREKESKNSSRAPQKEKKQSPQKEPDSTIEDIALLLADAAKNSSTRNKSQH